jgi:hypothetical protein
MSPHRSVRAVLLRSTFSLLLLFVVPLRAQWRAHHPGGGGQVQHIALDPTSPGVAYVLSDVEGLYRTDDGGTSWHHIGRQVHAGACYALAIDPADGRRLYLGTQRGVLVSDDRGDTWAPVIATTSHVAQNGRVTGLPVAAIAVSAAAPAHVYFANSWLIKHGLAVWPETGQNNGTTVANTDVYHPGVLWYSRDRGATWRRTTFEPATGLYLNVYSLTPHPTDPDQIYVGSHAGIYRGRFADDAWSWTAIPAPAGTVRGRGCDLTPDGNWLVAAYTTGGAEHYWEGQNKNGPAGSLTEGPGPVGLGFYVTRTASTAWTTLATGLPTNANSGGDRHTLHFWRPRIDPVGHSAADARVIMGTLGGAAGLWEARLQLPASGAPSLVQNWTRILWASGQQGFQFEQGWDTYTATCRIYDYVPASWFPGRARSEIWSSTNQTLLASNRTAAGWPTSAASWTERYSEPRGVVSGDGSTYKTFRYRGWQSTITEDIAFHANYALMCMRDNGYAESWDGGDSWTRFHRPNNLTNALAAHIVSDRSPAVALVGAGTGFYSSTDSRVHLMPLVSLTPEDDWLTPAAQPPGTVRILRALRHGGDHRVFAGSSAGLFEAPSLDALLSGVGAWQPVLVRDPASSVTLLESLGSIGDATDPAALYTVENGALRKGVWTGSAWSWTTLSAGAKSDLAAWRHAGSTFLAFTNDGTGASNPSVARLHLSADDGANWREVLTSTTLLATHAPSFWPFLHDQKGLKFSVVGAGAKIYLFAGSRFSRVGVAVLRGTIRGTASEPTVVWEDWSGRANARHEFPVVLRAKLQTVSGSPAIVTATNGAGAWSRPVQTPIEAWRAARFETDQPVGLAADDADPDGDGLPNLLEYALATDPHVPSAQPLSLTSTSTLNFDDTRLQVSFLRARPELTYTVESSSDLIAWSTVATNPGEVSPTLPVTVTDPESVSVSSRRFLRLRVSP